MSGPLLVVSAVQSELNLLPENPAAPPRTPPTSFNPGKNRLLMGVPTLSHQPRRPAQPRIACVASQPFSRCRTVAWVAAVKPAGAAKVAAW